MTALTLPAAGDGAETSDTLLVQLARSGDEASFEALYRMHAPRLHAFCLRMTRSRAAAEDVTQDVFLRAWRSLAAFRQESGFGTWLRSIAINALTDRHRRGNPADGTSEALEQLLAAAVSDTNLDLERAVAALPERARMVMLLAIDGYRYEEIATMLDVEVGTVKAQLHRARRLVREALQ